MNTFNVALTAEDIDLIGSLLDEQPYKKVVGLVNRVQAQINAQIAATVASAAPPDAPASPTPDAPLDQVGVE